MLNSKIYKDYPRNVKTNVIVKYRYHFFDIYENNYWLVTPTDLSQQTTVKIVSIALINSR